MADTLKQVGLRLPVSLLDQIDAAASAAHQDRSNWIRSACVAALTGPDASRNSALLEDIQVVDERAREVIKDLLRRVEALERVNGAPDPFI